MATTTNANYFLYRPKWNNWGTIFQVTDVTAEEFEEHFPEGSLEPISVAKANRIRRYPECHFSLVTVKSIDDILDLEFDRYGMCKSR